MRPDWLHFVTGLAIWFMIETLINRISIQLLNFSDIHLFPSYTTDAGENLWPIQSRAMRIKKILSEKGFRSIGIVKAQVHGHLKVRQALFLDADKAIRLGVVFIPNAQNRIQLYFSLCSVSESGKLYITDNQICLWWLLSRTLVRTTLSTLPFIESTYFGTPKAYESSRSKMAFS